MTYFKQEYRFLSFDTAFLQSKLLLKKLKPCFFSLSEEPIDNIILRERERERERKKTNGGDFLHVATTFLKISIFFTAC